MIRFNPKNQYITRKMPLYSVQTHPAYEKYYGFHPKDFFVRVIPAKYTVKAQDSDHVDSESNPEVAFFA